MASFFPCVRLFAGDISISIWIGHFYRLAAHIFDVSRQTHAITYQRKIRDSTNGSQQLKDWFSKLQMPRATNEKWFRTQPTQDSILVVRQVFGDLRASANAIKFNYGKLVESVWLEKFISARIRNFFVSSSHATKPKIYLLHVFTVADRARLMVEGIYFLVIVFLAFAILHHSGPRRRRHCSAP